MDLSHWTAAFRSRQLWGGRSCVSCASTGCCKSLSNKRRASCVCSRKLANSFLHTPFAPTNFQSRIFPTWATRAPKAHCRRGHATMKMNRLRISHIRESPRAATYKCLIGKIEYHLQFEIPLQFLDNTNLGSISSQISPI